jgi:hypothetical protein
MAMYDNLLANVPTDLWIGGKWRKASDGARFDVIDPATENKIASVASASVEDAKAAIDAAQGAFEAWAAKKPRERGEILRKAYELIMRDAERLAKLITIENGKALSDSRGEERRGSRAQHRPALQCAFFRRARRRAAQAGRRRRAGDAVEFPRRDGDAQDRSRARGGLPGRLEARQRNAAHNAGADAAARRGRRAGWRRQCHPVAPLRPGRERDAARSACARGVVHRLDGGRSQAAARGGRQHHKARDGARRQCAVHRVRRCGHRCGDRRRDDRQDAQHGRGLHRSEPLLCA